MLTKLRANLHVRFRFDCLGGRLWCQMVEPVPPGESLERHLISCTLLLFVHQIPLLRRTRGPPQRPLARRNLPRLLRGLKSGLPQAAWRILNFSRLSHQPKWLRHTVYFYLQNARASLSHSKILQYSNSVVQVRYLRAATDLFVKYIPTCLIQDILLTSYIGQKKGSNHNLCNLCSRAHTAIRGRRLPLQHSHNHSGF